MWQPLVLWKRFITSAIFHTEVVCSNWTVWNRGRSIMVRVLILLLFFMDLPLPTMDNISCDWMSAYRVWFPIFHKMYPLYNQYIVNNYVGQIFEIKLSIYISAMDLLKNRLIFENKTFLVHRKDRKNILLESICFSMNAFFFDQPNSMNFSNSIWLLL